MTTETIYRRGSGSAAPHYTAAGMADYLAYENASAEFTEVVAERYELKVSALDPESGKLWFCISDTAGQASSYTRPENGQQVVYRSTDNATSSISVPIYKVNGTVVAVYGAHPAAPGLNRWGTSLGGCIVMNTANAARYRTTSYCFIKGVSGLIAGRQSGTGYVAGKNVYQSVTNGYAFWFGDESLLDKEIVVHAGYYWFYYVHPNGYPVGSIYPNTRTVADGKTRALVTDVIDYNSGSSATLTTKKSTGSVSLVNFNGDKFRISAEAEGFATTDFRLLKGGSPQGEWEWLEDHGGKTMGEELSELDSSLASQQSQVSQLSNTVNAWQTYWDGDDVRVTITNYYGSTDDPHLYIEQKMPADDDHDAPWFKVVWDELTRLTSIIARIAAIETELPNKADRAWGYYDSANGSYSPDGLLQISHERIQIANDLAYTKQISTGCEVWVLTATEPTTITGVNSNGFFRITDGDGTPLLEIVKGDKRTVGATAANITVTASEVVIPYRVVSDDHPEVQWCPDLAAANWAPATVTWGGQSGNWIAHVELPATNSAFFKATYETGGETYIKHSVPCGLDRAYIGGRAYDITVDANGFLKVVQ